MSSTTGLRQRANYSNDKGLLGYWPDQEHSSWTKKDLDRKIKLARQRVGTNKEYFFVNPENSLGSEQADHRFHFISNVQSYFNDPSVQVKDK